MRVVNFYKFTSLDNLNELKAHLLGAAQSQGIAGFVVLAAEGLNAALSGRQESLERFIDWLRSDPRFADVVPKWSDADREPFKKFYVKIRPYIIRFVDDPGLTPQAINAAPRLSPSQLHRLLCDKPDDVVIVDTRNRYETEFGSFKDAALFPIQKFTEFAETFEKAYAADRDKRFVFFCTGGIRCEKVVPWALSRGFKHATQLDGGILGYFDQVGSEGFEGTCFVFDKRWLVDGTLKEADDDAVGPRLQPKPLLKASHDGPSGGSRAAPNP